MSQSHYLELRAIPQPELTQSQVLSHLMQALHQYLPAYAGRIGAAFPAPTYPSEAMANSSTAPKKPSSTSPSNP